MKELALLSLAALLAAAAPEKKPAPGEIAAAAPASDWADIAADDLLVMTLAPDPKGKPRQVLIQLMPPPLSEGWVGNIHALAKAHWWDGLSVYRVQDNYVTQWGDADGDDPKKAKPLPDGLKTVPESGYALKSPTHRVCDGGNCRRAPEPVTATLKAVSRDAYAPGVGFGHGWPLAFDDQGVVWPTHCYGMVGVARDLSPSTGTGAELYTVISHAPRHLDRNIALVGRVVEGMAELSSLPRGAGSLGVYEKPDERTPILSVRLASELPAAEQPHLQYLSTESATFARYAEAVANRRDPFFIAPAGGADLCNVRVPVRRRP